MMVQPRKTILEPSAARAKNATTGPERAGRADRVLRFTLPETITRLKLKPPENRWLEEDPASFRENLGLCSEDIFIFG